MTPNRFFHRQKYHLLCGRTGQALPLLMVTLLTLLALTFTTLHLGILQAETVRASNAVDSIALSIATWEARGLNVIAALNDGVLQCLRVIRWICVVWAGLAVAAAFGVGIPAFSAYSRYARSAIRSYWRLAKRLAEWADMVRKATPFFALEDAVSLASKHGVTAVIRPMNPQGPHDGAETLELHVSPSREIRLADAFSPLYGAIKKISNGGSKWVRTLLDGFIRTIVGEMGAPIKLLVPEEDLPRRQTVSVSGFVKTRGIAPALSFLVPPRNLPASSSAEAYGGGATEMKWRSRLRAEGARP